MKHFICFFYFCVIIDFMRINPKLKKRVIIAVVIIVCLSAAIFFIRYRKSKKKDEKEIYIENKLKVAGDYVYQGFTNPQEPKYFDYAIAHRQ